jgi:crossover junction endodeoxyribonuclease RuvC
MIFAAIDPGGVHAAIALFQDGHPVFVDDIRATNGILDSVALGKALHDMKVNHVVVENVHSMPRQGMSSTFKFGMGCGIIHGVIGALQLPMTLVSPVKWKTFFNLIYRDKEAARQRAIQVWPHLESYLARKKDSDRAEALLIGQWFYIQHVIPTEGRVARIAEEVRK